VPHPAGPLVLACAITHEAWRVDVVELGGAILASSTGRHASAAWAEVAAVVTVAVQRFQQTYGGRLRAMGVSVPGTVSPSLRLTASNLDWHDADLTALWPGPVLAAGNDATLAATAESHRGAAVGATVALHLRIEGGLGGAVVDHGRSLLGARGAAGEFGHMPFGDPAIACPCGAHGCWGTAVDGTALARLLNTPTPPDPVTYARRVIATASRAELEAHRIRSAAAESTAPTAPVAATAAAGAVAPGGAGGDARLPGPAARGPGPFPVVPEVRLARVGAGARGVYRSAGGAQLRQTGGEGRPGLSI